CQGSERRGHNQRAWWTPCPVWRVCASGSLCLWSLFDPLTLRLVLSLVLCFIGPGIAHRGRSLASKDFRDAPEEDCSLLPACDMMPPHRLGSAFIGGGCLMQSGWLRQYFVPQHNEQCQHTVALDTPSTASTEEGVSRRDFVTGGLVAGVAA